MIELHRGTPRTKSRTKTSARAAFVPLLATAALVLAACEAPGVPRALAAAAPSASNADAAPAQPAPGQGETPKAGGGAGAAVIKGTVKIELADFKITPNEFTVGTGKVMFAFNNTGRYTHDFRIEGKGIDVKAPKIGAGRTQQWSVALAPGTYRISCPISNHNQRGMEGTMVVVD